MLGLAVVAQCCWTNSNQFEIFSTGFLLCKDLMINERRKGLHDYVQNNNHNYEPDSSCLVKHVVYCSFFLNKQYINKASRLDN